MKWDKRTKNILIMLGCASLITLIWVFCLNIGETEKEPDLPFEISEEQEAKDKEIEDRLLKGLRELSKEDLKPVQDPPL